VSTRPELVAEHREIVGKKVSALRLAGKLPAVVYGHGHPSETIQLDAHEFEILRRHVGRNDLLDLTVAGGRARPVLLHAVHEHPVSRRTLHADFFVVRMTEEMTVDVPIQAVGESLAVDKLGGTLLHLKDTVQVRALPADLPSFIALDVSSLDSFEMTLHGSDLQVPERVTLLMDISEPIARVQPPRVELEPVGAAEVEAEAPAEGEGAEGATPGEGSSDES
jgi:large subunit ribosomal protein L25